MLLLGLGLLLIFDFLLKRTVFLNKVHQFLNIWTSIIVNMVVLVIIFEENNGWKHRDIKPTLFN